jgi:hypothetical protein
MERSRPSQNSRVARELAACKSDVVGVPVTRDSGGTDDVDSMFVRSVSVYLQFHAVLQPRTTSTCEISNYCSGKHDKGRLLGCFDVAGT